MAHPLIEKIELLFEEAKTNRIKPRGFFEQVWFNGVSLPKDPARQFIREVSEWAEQNKAKDPQTLALAIYTEAFIHFHAERYDDCLENITKAKAIFVAINDQEGIAMCAVQEGGVFRALGDLQLALKSFMEGTQYFEKHKVGDFSLMVGCYGMGGIYTEIGRYNEAIERYEMAGRLSHQLGAFGMQVFSLDGKAECFRQTKQFPAALENLTKAMELCAANNAAAPITSKVITDLGMYYWDLDDYEKALEYHQQALELREGAKMLGGAITNMVQIAEIYRKEGKNEEAINMLFKALSMAESVKIKPKIYRIHQFLSEIFEEAGDLSKSLFHFKLYHQIREEVEIEDAEKKMKNMQLIFEAEQTKKENVIIKAQKAEIERKNVELQETIDELTLSKINRKAKTITLLITVALIIAEDSFRHFILSHYTHDNFLIGLGASCVIVACVKPIERVVEHYLLHRFVKGKKAHHKTALMEA